MSITAYNKVLVLYRVYNRDGNDETYPIDCQIDDVEAQVQELMNNFLDYDLDCAILDECAAINVTVPATVDAVALEKRIEDIVKKIGHNAKILESLFD